MEVLIFDSSLTLKSLLYVLFACACWYFLKNKFRKKSDYSWTRQYPTPWLRLPFFGNVILCVGHVTRVAEMFISQTKKLGPLWIFWKYDKPQLIISDPEIAKLVLLSTTNLNKHSDYDLLISPVLGKNSLLTSPDPQWSHDRKYLQKAFHYAFFNDLIRISTEEGLSLITNLLNEAGNTVEVEKILSYCLIKISTRSQSKGRGHLSADVYKEFLYCADVGRQLSCIYGFLGFLKPSIFWQMFGFKELEQNLAVKSNAVVANFASMNGTEDTIEQNGESKADLWNLIFHPSKSFEWSKDQVITLVATAVDTLTISITMTLFYLANYPECLKKAIQEVDEVFPDSVSIITMNDLSKLKYLEMCWKEALRLHSPSALAGRNLSEPVTLPDGRYMPVGADVYVFIAAIHRDKTLFHDPDEFIPERFNEVNLKSIVPGSYIPFSSGPRNCIGSRTAVLQSKLLLAQILWNFNVSTAQKPNQIKSAYMITSNPFPAIQLKFHQRRY